MPTEKANNVRQNEICSLLENNYYQHVCQDQRSQLKDKRICHVVGTVAVFCSPSSRKNPHL